MINQRRIASFHLPDRLRLPDRATPHWRRTLDFIWRFNLFEAVMSGLSLWFFLILAFYNTPASPIATIPFAPLCLTAASLKVIGMARQSDRMRIAGLVIGSMFWLFLAAKLRATNAASITYGGYLVVVVGQTTRACQLAYARRRTTTGRRE